MFVFGSNKVIRQLVLVPLCVLSLLVSKGSAISKCELDKSVCGCKSEQGYIDLRPLAASPLVAKEASGTQYLWDVCRDFTRGSVKASSIQYIDASKIYDCGVYSSLKSDVDGAGNPVFSLTGAKGQRFTAITCSCAKSKDTSYVFVDEIPTGHYQLELKSEYCCPKQESGGSSSSGLSAGSVILIIMLVAIAVYLVGGVVFMSTVKRAEGLERIPHVTFWTAVPGLVWAGIRFTFTCGKSPSYQEV